MVRRQRERARQQKRREKQAKRAERRELKKQESEVVVDDSMGDPTIDWSAAVRQTKVEVSDFPIPELDEVVEETES
jgi:hypothetical protein